MTNQHPEPTPGSRRAARLAQRTERAPFADRATAPAHTDRLAEGHNHPGPPAAFAWPAVKSTEQVKAGTLTEGIIPSRRARRLAANMEATMRTASAAPTRGSTHGTHAAGMRTAGVHDVSRAHHATMDPQTAEVPAAAGVHAHAAGAGTHLKVARVHGVHVSNTQVSNTSASNTHLLNAHAGAHRREHDGPVRRPLAELRTRLSAVLRGDADSRLGRLRARLSARPRRQLPVVAVSVMVAALVATGLGCAQQSVATVDVDGTISHVAALTGTVGDMLDANGVKVGSHDLVSPALNTPAYGVDEVVVRHAHQVTVDVDGKPTTQWTTAQNVDQLMSDMGIRGSANVSASRSEPIDRNGMTVSVSTEKNVTVVVDGQTLTGTTNAATVGDVLAERGVMLGENDRTTVPLSAPTVDGLVVSVVRVASSNGTVMESIPYNTVQQDDPTLAKGQTKVAQKGVVGTRKSVYEVQQVGGVNVGKTLVAASVVAEPKDEIVKVGTKEATTDTGGQPLPDYGTSDPRSIAREMVQQRGWGDDQFVCLDNLWSHESGWRVDATNPSSGAYGIPQALPGSKMASVGPDWKTNPATQITWGLNYITSRYGTPCGAWSSYQVKHWY